MGYPPLEPLLWVEVEAFLAVSGTKASVLGEEAVGNPSFVGRLHGGASPCLGTFDWVRAWMAANATRDELRAVRETSSARSARGWRTWRTPSTEPGTPRKSLL